MYTRSATVDIAIFGGGVLGLWLQNALENLGLSTLLLESNALGAGQTLRSQGIIHGGTKYALKGLLTASVDPVRDMPARWKSCLQGQGDIDLQAVQKLSEAQYLWSTGQLSSDILSFFGSLALQSSVQKLKKPDFPIPLQDPSYKGSVYQLDEIVLDTQSLIKNLAKPHQHKIFKIDMDMDRPSNSSFYIHFNDLALRRNQNGISYVEIQQQEQKVKLYSQYYIFTAGAGNELLTRTLLEIPLMQRRPLQMVYVIFDNPEPSLGPLFGHCMDGGTNPRLSITTHFTEAGKTVWYLGGELAEQGAKRSQAEQIAFAKSELKALFPWINFNSTHTYWNSFYIDRAEGMEIDGKRPNSFSLHTGGNVMTAWPTKLALTPKLSDAIIQFITQKGIEPQKMDISAIEDWERPAFASPPWETLNS